MLQRLSRTQHVVQLLDALFDVEYDFEGVWAVLNEYMYAPFKVFQTWGWKLYHPLSSVGVCAMFVERPHRANGPYGTVKQEEKWLVCLLVCLRAWVLRVLLLLLLLCVCACVFVRSCFVQERKMEKWLKYKGKRSKGKYHSHAWLSFSIIRRTAGWRVAIFSS